MISKKLESYYKNQKPFVVYRKPNCKTISGFFLESSKLNFTNSYLESGFVFAPFDNKEKTILFPLNESLYMEESISSFDINNNNFAESKFSDAAKKFHVNLVDKTIKAIENSDLKKVVISRKEALNLVVFNLEELFLKLLKKYENAFVYVWYHPEIGLWVGATPETLVQITDNHFRTMSLAGTKLVSNKKEQLDWTSKEFEEQQLVTDYIKNQLENLVTDLKVHELETVKAGSLLHLRTKVTAVIPENLRLIKVLKALHPTPAICGLPRETAKQFILENENYDRDFYTGFLGELNLKNNKTNNISSSLFVNLRCMQINKNAANIYVGGGITKDSNALKEWEETVSKSKTMKSLFQ